MKKIVPCLFVLMSLFVACGEKPVEVPETMVSFDICISPTNRHFGNMLNTELRDDILACGITLEHNGETYPLEWPESRSAAEATEERSFRVEPRDPGVDETLVMRFGKFHLNGDGFRGETFTIDWGEIEHCADKLIFDFYSVERESGAMPLVEIQSVGKRRVTL